MNYTEIVEFVKKNLKKTVTKDSVGDIAVEFDIYGEGEGAFYVKICGGKPEVEPYEYYDRDAKVYITAEELVKIVNGERNPRESFECGILMVEGNIDAAQSLINLIKVPLKKKSVKNSDAKKSVRTEKKIVAETKKKDSKISKDIKADK